jgi:hypothetical protein
MSPQRQDSGCPLVHTAVPYWNESLFLSSTTTTTSSSSLVASATERLPQHHTRQQKFVAAAPAVAISIDEVQRKRRDIASNRQCSLHMACQQNAPLTLMAILIRSFGPHCHVALSHFDCDGNLPMMIGEL